MINTIYKHYPFGHESTGNPMTYSVFTHFYYILWFRVKIIVIRKTVLTHRNIRRPADLYMSKRIRPLFIQIIVCRQFCAKPFWNACWLMLIGSFETDFGENWFKYHHFHSLTPILIVCTLVTTLSGPDCGDSCCQDHFHIHSKCSLGLLYSHELTMMDK